MTITNTFIALSAADLRVTDGANIGDGLDNYVAAVPEDRYRLMYREEPFDLTIATPNRAGAHFVAGLTSGTKRIPVILAGVATFMSLADATVIECVIVASPPNGTNASALWLVPTGSISPETDYSLTELAVDSAKAQKLLSQMLSASFVAGTHVMRGDRSFVLVDDLRVGDTLFTRDNGVQPIRQIHQRTVRAEGQFAPVTIAAKTHGAHAPVCLLPTHRVLAFRRGLTGLGAPSRHLVAASNLVDGGNVTQTTGGYIDTYQVVLDNHEIVFAEGVAVESQMPLDVFSRAEGLQRDGAVRRRLERQHDYAQAITTNPPRRASNKP